MEASQKRVRWTYAEFARLPSEGSTRYEIIEDELYMTPAPSRRHQGILMRLSSRLHLFATEHDLGEVYPTPFDVLFAEGDYLEPDIVFVRRDRLPILSERGVEGAPDFLVEILSPSTSARDRGIKLDRYRHFGVAEYWIVDGDAGAVQVWDLVGGATEARTVDRDGTLAWTPMPDGPTLSLPIADILPPAD